MKTQELIITAQVVLALVGVALAMFGNMFGGVLLCAALSLNAKNQK